MEFIGQHLKKIRIKKKIDLLSISKELKISKNALKDIESDNFPEFLNPVYLVGHIRSYAKFLGLDQDEIIENFKVQISYNSITSKEEISKPIKNNTIFSLNKIFTFTSISLIFFSFYFLFVMPSDLQQDYLMTSDVPENLQYNLEKTEMNISLNKKLNQGNAIKNFDNSPDQNIFFQENESNFFNSSSAKASFQNNNIKDDLDNEITLKFLYPTWIQLRDNDDKIILSKLMDQGDEYTYTISQNFNLTTGNAGNIVILFDGIVKGKAGKIGEVLDSIVIDNNFHN